MLYADPGSGALLWQMVAAGLVGAMFYVRKIFGIFRRKDDSTTTASEPGGSSQAERK